MLGSPLANTFSSLPKHGLHYYIICAAAVACLVVILVSGSFASTWTQRPPYSLCDAFDLPGYLVPDFGQPLQTDWHSLVRTCPSPPRWIDALAHFVNPVEGSNEDHHLAAHLSFMRDQTVLILGDSVDRNGVDGLGMLIGISSRQTNYDDLEGFSGRGNLTDHQAPRLLHIPQLDFRIVNAFHYGMQDSPWFSDQNTLLKPGAHEGPFRFEDRLDRLASRLPRRPSLVVFQSSLWDLRYFWDLESYRGIPRGPLSPLFAENITWYQSRLEEALHHTKASFPHSDVLFRGIYYVPSTQSAWHSNRRVAQLRQAQLVAAREARVPYLDFAQIWTGFDDFIDGDVHLAGPPAPGTVALMWPILHHLYRSRYGARRSESGWPRAPGRDWRLPPNR